MTESSKRTKSQETAREEREGGSQQNRLHSATAEAAEAGEEQLRAGRRGRAGTERPRLEAFGAAGGSPPVEPKDTQMGDSMEDQLGPSVTPSHVHKLQHAVLHHRTEMN